MDIKIEEKWMRPSMLPFTSKDIFVTEEEVEKYLFAVELAKEKLSSFYNEWTCPHYFKKLPLKDVKENEEL